MLLFSKDLIVQRVQEFDLHFAQNIGLVYMLIGTIANGVYMIVIKLSPIHPFQLIFESQCISVITSLSIMLSGDYQIVIYLPRFPRKKKFKNCSQSEAFLVLLLRSLLHWPWKWFRWLNSNRFSIWDHCGLGYWAIFV
jgi:hypothetical protein